MVEKVALLQRFREVQSSNLGPETSYPENLFVRSVPTSKFNIFFSDMGKFYKRHLTDSPIYALSINNHVSEILDRSVTDGGMN